MPESTVPAAPYAILDLPSGLRVIHQPVAHTKVSHCGFLFDTGSRDEAPDQLGLAHFWEHMAFKGTRKRRAWHILNRLETVGGELNAYTTKEKISFHASVLSQHFERALELLTDITFHSTFPEKEIEKERGVILEEMAMYLDAPEDAIADEFDTLTFPGGHPLGTNILGSKESVGAFQQADFQRFVEHQTSPAQGVFASVSNLPTKTVFRLAEKYLSDLPARAGRPARVAPSGYQAQWITEEKPIQQAHCVLGAPAFAIQDPRRVALFLLTNVLGGPGANSRLNLAVREKYGLVYAIDAAYNGFQDTGQFSIYFGTEKKQLARTVGLVKKELKKIRDVALTTTQLHTAKAQLMGQLAMAEESTAGLMSLLGRSLLDLGRVESIEEVFAQIRRITAKELLEIANEVLAEDRLSGLMFVPEGR